MWSEDNSVQENHGTTYADTLEQYSSHRKERKGKVKYGKSTASDNVSITFQGKLGFPEKS